MDNWKNSDYRKIKLVSASNFKVPLFNKPALLQQFNCPIYLLSLCIIILEIDTTKLMGPLYHIISAQLYGLDWMTGFSATESINARKFRKKKGLVMEQVRETSQPTALSRTRRRLYSKYGSFLQSSISIDIIILLFVGTALSDGFQ